VTWDTLAKPPRQLPTKKPQPPTKKPQPPTEKRHRTGARPLAISRNDTDVEVLGNRTDVEGLAAVSRTRRRRTFQSPSAKGRRSRNSTLDIPRDRSRSTSVPISIPVDGPASGPSVPAVLEERWMHTLPLCGDGRAEVRGATASADSVVENDVKQPLSFGVRTTPPVESNVAPPRRYPSPPCFEIYPI
jgi:hypothetical protein